MKKGAIYGGLVALVIDFSKIGRTAPLPSGGKASTVTG